LAELDRMTITLEVTIRLARQEDLAHLETWQGFDSAEHRKALRYYLTAQRIGSGALLVAEAGGVPVGQLFLWYRRLETSLADGVETISITAMRVHPEFRRRGIATRLAQVAEGLARDLGYRWVTIGTDVDNDAAHRLYRSWGYEEFVRNTYEWDGRHYPQICLRKRLDHGAGGPEPLGDPGPV